MTKEQEYHNSRTTFAIMDGNIHYGPKGLSHKDWLVGRGIISEDAYNEIVRGYFDDSGIYFYQGNFETNDLVENTARTVANQFDNNLPIYCGCIIGEIGEKWKPIKQLR